MNLTTALLMLSLVANQILVIAAQAHSATSPMRNLSSVQQDQIQQFGVLRSATADMQGVCFSLSRINHTSALLDCNTIFREYRSLTRSLVACVQVEMNNAATRGNCARFVAESHKAIGISDRTSRKSAELHTCMLQNFVSKAFTTQMRELKQDTLHNLEQFLQTVSYKQSVFAWLDPWSSSTEGELKQIQLVETARMCIRQIEDVVSARETFVQLLSEAGHMHKVFGKQSADSESDWDPPEDDADLDGGSISESGCTEVQLRSMQNYLKDAKSILGL